MLTNRHIFTGFVASLVLACVPLIAFAQGDAWKELLFPDDGFAISSPAQLSLTSDSNQHVYRGMAGDDLRLVVLVKNISGKTDQETEGMVKEAFQGAPGFQKESLQELNFQGHPGVQARTQNSKGRSISRAYCVDGRLYMFDVTDSPEGLRFLDSFRLLPAQWKEYLYTDDGFAIAAPSEPQISQGTGGAKTFKVDLPHLDGFLLNVMPAAPAPDAASAKVRLSQLRDSLTQAVRGKLVTQTDLSLGNNPGLAFELETVSDGGKRPIRGRVFYVGSVLYVIMAKGNPDFQRFFDSFRLVEKPH